MCKAGYYDKLNGIVTCDKCHYTCDVSNILIKIIIRHLTFFKFILIRWLLISKLSFFLAPIFYNWLNYNKKTNTGWNNFKIAIFI